MSKSEIEGILSQPFSMLSRQDMTVRKLLSKYHDNPEALKRKFTEAAHGFDPQLAERTRSKNKLVLNKEEREWVSLDKVLHPEVMIFYIYYYIQYVVSVDIVEGNNGITYVPYEYTGIKHFLLVGVGVLSSRS